MELEVTVSEIADIFKEIQERPGQLFEMIRLDIGEVVGKYLTTMMNAELTHCLLYDPETKNLFSIGQCCRKFSMAWRLSVMNVSH